MERLKGETWEKFWKAVWTMLSKAFLQAVWTAKTVVLRALQKQRDACSPPADLQLPWGRESLDTVQCLFGFLCICLLETGVDPFVPLPQGNLVDMEGCTAGKRRIRGISKCATLEKQSSQWDVFRHKSKYTISDLKMSPIGFRGNTLVCKSEKLTH